jgi:perosamine synthetase
MRAGGKVRRMINYGHQSISDADCQAVVDVLKGDWLTQGPAVEAFESALATALGVPHAVSCANGTAALHLSALALGWGPGDVVLVPAITFLASANCAAYVGAEPFFVDIDRTLTIDPVEVERHVIALRARGKKVRAVVGVDMGGHPCDWPALRALADRHGLDLVDDACHALGAVGADGERVGSGRYADLTTLSFHPVKHITTAEGGAVLTRNGKLAESLARLRSHGTVRGPEAVSGWEGPWHYDMVDLGYNYRLSDLQAALGVSQMRRLPQFVARRRAIADRYRTLFAGNPRVRCPEERAGATHAYHLFATRLDFEAAGRSRREVFDRCGANGVALQVHYRPVFMNSFYHDREINRGAESWTPNSCAYYRQAVSLPMYPDLTDDDIDYVAGVIAEAIG